MGLKETAAQIYKKMILAPVKLTADVLSSALDRQGRAGYHPMLLAMIGASGDTLSGSVKIEVYVLESDDDSTYAAAADESVQNAIAGAAQTGTFAVIDDPSEDELMYVSQYLGSKRYVKVGFNLIGTHTNGTPCAAAVEVLHPENSMPA